MSRTYTDVLYGSRQCMIYEQTSCSLHGSLCLYHALYVDQSRSIGNLASETIGLGSTWGEPMKFPNIVFGCGYNNDRSFNSHTSGLTCLGDEGASLSNCVQIWLEILVLLGPYLSETKFSSKLAFGSNTNAVSRGVVSTPMVRESPKTFYHMTLEEIGVNWRKFKVSGSSGQGANEGNIIIVSGTTLTMLPPDLYNQILHAVFAAIHLPRIEDPYEVLNLCCESSGLINNTPEITVHFTGAYVGLKWYNAFDNVAEAVTCFSFIPLSSDLSIYGNLEHMNFLVGFDFTYGVVQAG